MKPDRPVLGWAESLERFRKMQPEHMVGSHNRPLSGARQIDEILANTSKAIRYVHDETVKGLNQGLTLEQIRDRVKLPEDLAKLPYLQPNYGSVAWGINGIVKQYTGWYDMNPAHLNPGSSKEYFGALVETAGAENLVKRGQKALNEGKPQLALELADAVLNASPDDKTAHSLAAEACTRLGQSALNTVERNVYRAAALEHRQKQ
jgi:alkyl sulfatase BDS1-like metallo-beta-lactamase superfamily hydrolase